MGSDDTDSVGAVCSAAMFAMTTHVVVNFKQGSTGLFQGEAPIRMPGFWNPAPFRKA